MTEIYSTYFEDKYLTDLEYCISSSLDIMHEARFCQKISGNILKIEAKDYAEEIIGSIEGWKILINLSKKSSFNLLSVADYEASVMIVAEDLLDFRYNTWKDKVIMDQTKIIGNDLLILSRLEILPKFRGLGIGKKAIKDLYNNFSQGCGLFALKCFPLQCGAKDGSKRKDKFRMAMEFEKFESEYEKAFKSLQKYYKSLGFQTISGVDESIMIINTSARNRRFDKIKLE